jgi:hypothetical protein
MRWRLTLISHFFPSFDYFWLLSVWGAQSILSWLSRYINRLRLALITISPLFIRNKFVQWGITIRIELGRILVKYFMSRHCAEKIGRIELCDWWCHLNWSVSLRIIISRSISLRTLNFVSASPAPRLCPRLTYGISSLVGKYTLRLIHWI